MANANNRKFHTFAIILSSICIGGGLSLLFYLSSTYTEPQAESSASIHSTEQLVIDNPSQTGSQLIVQNLVAKSIANNPTHILSNKQIEALLSAIGSDNYKTDLLASQSDILKGIKAINGNVEELGYLFLPDKPATVPQLQEVKQLDIPLLLQKDPQWRSVRYGSDTTRELGENGCAILSLAMVHSYYSERDVTPQDIISWSKETFYLHNQGTSWNIFHSFAEQYGYTFFNHSNSFASAMHALGNGEVVIASVDPGTFTDVGHILVIRGYQDGKVYVNDPNDDPSKMFSVQGIDESVFLNEGVNYWSFAKRTE